MGMPRDVTPTVVYLYKKSQLYIQDIWGMSGWNSEGVCIAYIAAHIRLSAAHAVQYKNIKFFRERDRTFVSDCVAEFSRWTIHKAKRSSKNNQHY